MPSKHMIEIAKEVNLRDVVAVDFPDHIKSRDHIKIQCQFHNERTPSLAIYDHRYYCYACGAKGDIIDWVRKVYNITFNEAVRVLYEYARGQHN